MVLSLLKPQWLGGERGLVVRALHLQAGGPGFKSSSLPLDGFVFGGPEFNSWGF